MTIHLIDGHAGRAHITGDDMAKLNAACFGVNNGVFDYGERFRTSTYGGGTVVVYGGVGLVNGRRFIIDSSEQLTLSAGISGMKRIDLIYAAYSKASSTGPNGADYSETVRLDVMRGTTTTGAPTAPDLGDDGLPLWRVPFNGTSMGAPEQAFELIPTAASTRVEKLYENGYWRVVRHGGAVSVFARGIVTSSGSTGYVHCRYTVPREYCPATEVLTACVTQNGDGGAGYLRVKPDGTITMGQLGGGGSTQPRYGQLTWVPGM